jgi:hypothetical protein
MTRQWIAAATGALLLFVAGPLAAQLPDPLGPECRPPVSEAWKAERAVSLKQLEIDLGHCGDDCPAAAKQLYGLGRVDGYVLDPDLGDIVLFGPEIQSGAPVQYTDSFVVALRAAAHRYDQVKGNTRISTPPGLTLNPRPRTIAALYRATAGPPAGFVSRFCKACTDVQDLIVYGMPFDSLPSAIMAFGDLALKRMSSSELSVPVAGFSVLAERRREAVEQALHEGLPIPGASFNRFWYFPGMVAYREQSGGGAVALERADVVIRQQPRVAAADGRSADGGPPDPIAVQWACHLSRLYPQIAAQAPDSGFDGIARLLRIFAIAQLIIEHDATGKSGLDLGYFLDRHLVATVPLSREWPGLAHVQRVEYRQQSGSRVSIAVIEMPSCGGVEFRLDSSNVTSETDPDHLVQNIAQRIIADRPSVTAQAWTVRVRSSRP